MQQRKQPARWPWLLVVVAVAGAGWWMFRPQGEQAASQQPPAFPSQAAQQPAAPQATPQTGTEPTPIQHPIDSPDAADAALPPLADSDAELWSVLQQLAGNDDVLGVLLRDHLIQRIVVMVDNLTKPSIARSALALNALPGELQVQPGENGSVQLLPSNSTRYAPFVQAFSSADPEAVASAYKRLYPLFQQAYAELGEPTAYFNDRLVQVIDSMLQAPEPTLPLTLVPAPNGRYRFADPALEALPVGQKALVRLGPEQAAQVKQQLRRLRAALTRG